MKRRILITGGAGFIGCNAAARFLSRGWDVAVLDNLSRPGSALNLEWLRAKGLTRFVHADVRDQASLQTAVAGEGAWDAVLHLAGQVAVTLSVQDPRMDLETNLLGTFNLLEAVRLAGGDPLVLYASTNKVYGGLTSLRVEEQESRHVLPEAPLGVSEDQPLDFHSPYGCSKGAADQYVRDYARIYGTRTVVFRQSCIYGPRQFGVEDQGWLAHFLIRHSEGREAVVYGDGKQVRDVLHVDDLLDAYEAAIERASAGSVYNIGGGPDRTLSIREAFAAIERLTGHPVAHRYAETRPGDQPVFVSDLRKAERELGWKPRVFPREGLADLHRWTSTLAGQTVSG